MAVHFACAGQALDNKDQLSLSGFNLFARRGSKHWHHLPAMPPCADNAIHLLHTCFQARARELARRQQLPSLIVTNPARSSPHPVQLAYRRQM